MEKVKGSEYFPNAHTIDTHLGGLGDEGGGVAVAVQMVALLPCGGGYTGGSGLDDLRGDVASVRPRANELEVRGQLGVLDCPALLAEPHPSGVDRGERGQGESRRGGR